MFAEPEKKNTNIFSFRLGGRKKKDNASNLTFWFFVARVVSYVFSFLFFFIGVPKGAITERANICNKKYMNQKKAPSSQIKQPNYIQVL